MGVGLIDVTAKRAALTPHEIAFADAITGETMTYSALDERASRCAHLLQMHGVGQADRVAILSRNRVEFFELMFACAKLGAILVPLNWRSPAAELSALIDDCSPQILFFGGEDGDTAAALRRPGLTLIDLENAYDPALEACAPLATNANWPSERTWTLLYTSGTTGRPKAVIQTFQMAAVNAFHAMQAFGVTAGDHTLNFLPLCHTAGIQLLTLPTLIVGGRVTILPKFEADQILAFASKVDVFFGVPAVYQQMALSQNFGDTDLSRVRVWGCGGAPLPDVLVETYAARGAIVRNGYGMTETGPTAFVASKEDSLRKIGSVGKPQMLVEARIVDRDGGDVPPQQVGELWLRGPGLTPGYWRRPDETAAAFASDGWMKTGDLGRRDADGAYFIEGRIKEMYISGGENVYPAEVENALARHPAILEAAVVGVPDPKWGEVGCAYLMLREGALRPDASEIIAFCRTQLAPFKAPRTVIFIEDFPRTASGKIRKHLLRDMAPAPVG